jgi:hypothetical protein
MTDNYISVRHWGLFPDVAEETISKGGDMTASECEAFSKKLSSAALRDKNNFIQGYEAAFGLHLLEGVN